MRHIGELVKLCSLEFLKDNFKYLKHNDKYMYVTGICGDGSFPEEFTKYCGKVFEICNIQTCEGYLSSYELKGIEYKFDPRYIASITFDNIKDEFKIIKE